MRTLRLLFSAAFILFFVTIAFAQKNKEADQIVDTWLTEDKDAKIEIYKVGDKYNGKIVWLKNPLDENGKPKVDKENDDPKLKTRPLLGLELLRGFEYDEDNEWDDGKIYDPKSGNTYSCYIELQENGKKLKVRGYIGFSLIGRTSYWTRVE